jgi:hypothetical protein
MRELSLSKSISRVMLLQPDSSGGVKSITLYKRGRKKRGSTWGLRGLEKVVCRTIEAQKALGALQVATWWRPIPAGRSRSCAWRSWVRCFGHREDGD